MAATGHNSVYVRPTHNVTPCLVWSVFDPLIRTNKHFGFTLSSTMMSSGVKCHIGSNWFAAGTVNSPERKKAKKARQQAAHSMMLLNSYGLLFKEPLIAFNMYGVIGSLVSFALGFLLFNPFNANCNLNELANGSGQPAAMCMCRTADK